jgi:hypothetical protein
MIIKASFNEKTELFLRENKIIFPQLLDGLEVAKRYRLYAYPAEYLIDSSGKIIYAGPFDKERIISLVESYTSKSLTP